VARARQEALAALFDLRTVFCNLAGVQDSSENNETLADPLLRAAGICKQFDAIVALDGVDFELRSGEIHALVGENGAGKSTLIRILGGVHPPDRGMIFVAGQARAFASPRAAIAAGIVTIPQELRLLPALSIAENIALGEMTVRRLGPIRTIDRAGMNEQARTVLAQLEFYPDPRREVRSLSFAERQLVAIAKGLRRQCRIFIMDEPTAALEKREIERLFLVLERLRAQGTAILYISHELDEVVAIADRCTVLRDGRVVAACERGVLSVPDLVRAMTGSAAATDDFVPIATGDVLMVARPDGVTPVELRAGEVLGMAGLLGSGAEKMLHRIFGMEEPIAIELGGRRQHIREPRHAIAAGFGMVPGERALGLVLAQSVRDNLLLPNLDLLTRLGWLDRKAGDRLVAELMETTDVRPRQPSLPVRALSGGNQQKVIFAKWLARKTALLLLAEPTLGVDVAAKAQIHALIREFVRRGHAALINSSDLGELGRLCGSVLAIRRGRIAARLDRPAGLDEASLRTAIGG
jgi:ABC-type sugar transport system ATPase subunit